MLVPSYLIRICWVYPYACLGRTRTPLDACWMKLWLNLEHQIWLLYLLFLRLIKYYQVLKMHRNCQSRLYPWIGLQASPKQVCYVSIYHLSSFNPTQNRLSNTNITSCLLVAATCFPNIIPSFRSYLQGKEGIIQLLKDQLVKSSQKLHFHFSGINHIYTQQISKRSVRNKSMQYRDFLTIFPA